MDIIVPRNLHSKKSNWQNKSPVVLYQYLFITNSPIQAKEKTLTQIAVFTLRRVNQRMCININVTLLSTNVKTEKIFQPSKNRGFLSTCIYLGKWCIRWCLGTWSLKLISIKPLTSFSLEQVGLTEQLFG